MSGPAAGPTGPITRLVRTGRAAADELPAQQRVLGGLVAACVVIVVLVALAPDTVPFTALLLPLLGASLLLSPRLLPGFVVFVLVMVLVALVSQDELTTRVLAAAGILLAACLVVLAASRRRNRLGVDAVTGEAMLVDLRDQILDQSAIPELPSGWRAQCAKRSAGGTPFSGDVVVASRRTGDDGAAGGDHLDLVLLDVAGTRDQAGTRALVLAGVFGGLLGALPAGKFLLAANQYLLRQSWSDGVASAVHLSVDLTTGAFEVRTAGHPPVVIRQAGSGRWSALTSEGPVLGLVDDADYRPASGVLGPGDVVVLYTDGMVEQSRRDVGLGIDRMLGGAERLFAGRPEDAAERLVDSVGSGGDDRTLVLLGRV